MEKELINYEIVKQKKDVLLTYSLEDADVLGDCEKVFVVAKETTDKKYDLIVSDEIGNDLLKFKSLDTDMLESLAGKRVLLAGLSEENGEIIDVALVENLSIENRKKMKMN